MRLNAPYAVPPPWAATPDAPPRAPVPDAVLMPPPAVPPAKWRAPVPEGIDTHPVTLRVEAGDRTFDVRAFKDATGEHVLYLHMVDLLRVACDFPVVAASSGPDKQQTKPTDLAANALNKLEQKHATFQTVILNIFNGFIPWDSLGFLLV